MFPFVGNLTEDELISAAEVRRGRELNSGLVSLLRSEAFYTIRRLLAADQKNMYNREFLPELDDFYEETGMEVSHNIRKGGVSLTPYLTYGW